MDLTPGIPPVKGDGKTTPLAGVEYAGYLQEQTKDGDSAPLPQVGLPNAVTDEHHRDVIHNESGIVLPGGQPLPSSSAPPQTATEAEAPGPKVSMGDQGSRGT